MAGSTPKRHHYVPQFYLRNFSKDGRRINLFNFRKKQPYLGPLRGQCAVKRFYSLEKEGEFAKLEGTMAQTLRFLLDDPSYLDAPDLRDTLLGFIVFQSLRTPGALRTPAALEAQVKAVAAEYGVDDEEVHAELGLAGLAPGEEMLFCGENAWASAKDLEMCLVENTSNQELITSDDPVVRYNQYCRGSANAENGWSMVGLQVFFPLSPRYLLLLYDPQIYRIRRPRQLSSVVRTSQPRDVAELNALQILHARDNVYYLGEQGSTNIEFQCRRRAKSRSRTMVVEEHMLNAQGTKRLVTNYFAPLRHELSLSFLNVKKDYARFSPEYRWGKMRTGNRDWRRRPDLRGGRKPDRVTRR